MKRALHHLQDYRRGLDGRLRELVPLGTSPEATYVLEAGSQQARNEEKLESLRRLRQQLDRAQVHGASEQAALGWASRTAAD